MKNRKNRMNGIFGIWVIIAMLMMQACGEKAPKMQMEQLDRGVVAVRETSEDVFVTWRYLSSDPLNTSFNISGANQSPPFINNK